MTRDEFINLAKGWGYWCSDETIKECFDAWSDDEIFPGAGITKREETSAFYGVSTEEEWLDYCATYILPHY